MAPSSYKIASRGHGLFGVLPNELAVEVFRRVMDWSHVTKPSVYDGVSYNITLTRIMLVSRRWAALVKSDPRLWTVISSIQSPASRQRSLKRSDTHRLYICAHFSRDMNEVEAVQRAFVKDVVDHASRWRFLAVASTVEKYILVGIYHATWRNLTAVSVDDPYTLFTKFGGYGGIANGECHNLRHLRLYRSDIPFSYMRLFASLKTLQITAGKYNMVRSATAEEILGWISSMPHLEELQVEADWAEDFIRVEQSPGLITWTEPLPSLKKISTNGLSPGVIEVLLRHADANTNSLQIKCKHIDHVKSTAIFQSFGRLTDWISTKTLEFNGSSSFVTVSNGKNYLNLCFSSGNDALNIPQLLEGLFESHQPGSLNSVSTLVTYLGYSTMDEWDGTLSMIESRCTQVRKWVTSWRGGRFGATRHIDELLAPRLINGVTVQKLPNLEELDIQGEGRFKVGSLRRGVQARMGRQLQTISCDIRQITKTEAEEVESLIQTLVVRNPGGWTEWGSGWAEDI